MDVVSEQALSSTEIVMRDISTSESSMIQLNRFRAESLEVFSKWRPECHFLPATGWLNDPCAPCYDKKTGLYHLAFQWNPHSPFWERISWGHAVSSNLFDWCVDKFPVLKPDRNYDWKGVFSGCMLQLSQSESLVFYTSVSRLPVHYTIPYHPGAETLSIASSADGGQSWVKNVKNPVLDPIGDIIKEHDITGWRDPFVTSWPNMDLIMGRPLNSGLYGLLSGGFRNITPTAFVYDIDTNDPSRWKFINALMRTSINFKSSYWSPDFGTNWEVTNLLSIFDPVSNVNRDFLLISAEGQRSRSPDMTPSRQSIWISGKLKNNEFTREIEMSCEFSGVIDYDNFYAANSFKDSTLLDASGNESYVIWGWIPEDPLPELQIAKQKWSGAMSDPRVISVHTLENVVGALQTPLSDLTNCEVVGQGGDTFRVTTLGISTHPKFLASYRQRCTGYYEVQATTFIESSTFHCSPLSSSWLLETAVDRLPLSQHTAKFHIEVGFILSDETNRCISRITYNTFKEKILIDRSMLASSDSGAQTHSICAPHTLFYLKEKSDVILESLKFRLFFDKSVLSVFVNDRTAATTRLYLESTKVSVSLFVMYCSNEDAQGMIKREVTFTDTKMWWGGICKIVTE
ncbi:glycosyl hydrolase [Dipodascopsis uninucleata]